MAHPPYNTIELEHRQNNLRISYVAVNALYPDGLYYERMLEGFDEEWYRSDRMEAYYTNLPPGDYTFKVRACTDDGVCSEESSIEITIYPPFWQTAWFMILVIFGILGIIFLLFRWRLGELKKAKVRLEAMVEERTSELRKEKEIVEDQNFRILKQSEELEDYNRNITDSINYAKRIQSAIMQPMNRDESRLKDNMCVFYLPKDIVSGDFYWWAEEGDYSYFSAADCTGHGVPGAFMSMIGISYLNQMVGRHKGYTSGQVLDRLRAKIIADLVKDSRYTQKDGMDMALCRVNWKTLELNYAGANNPLWIVRDGEILQTKADKMPIGEHVLKDVSFKDHHVQLQPGDSVYVFTDGYADQFGGEKGKKFMYRRLKEIFLSINNLPVKEQNIALKKAFMEWKGEYEQIDDVLVMGVHF